MPDPLPDEKNMTSQELAQAWGLSNDGAIIVMDKLHQKDQQIQELIKENNRLKSKTGSRALMNGIGTFIANSWGWIFVILIFGGPTLYSLVDRVSPRCPNPPAQEQSK